jgi:hypothetical protein
VIVGGVVASGYFACRVPGEEIATAWLPGSVSSVCSVETAPCDFFRIGQGMSVGGASWHGRDSASGLDHLRASVSSVSCALAAPKSGRFTLRTGSTLQTCMPRDIAASATIFRERAR